MRGDNHKVTMWENPKASRREGHGHAPLPVWYRGHVPEKAQRGPDVKCTDLGAYVTYARMCSDCVALLDHRKAIGRKGCERNKMFAASLYIHTLRYIYISTTCIHLYILIHIYTHMHLFLHICLLFFITATGCVLYILIDLS